MMRSPALALPQGIFSQVRKNSPHGEGFCRAFCKTSMVIMTTGIPHAQALGVRSEWHLPNSLFRDQRTHLSLDMSPQTGNSRFGVQSAHENHPSPAHRVSPAHLHSAPGPVRPRRAVRRPGNSGHHRRPAPRRLYPGGGLPGLPGRPGRAPELLSVQLSTRTMLAAKIIEKPNPR
jgi:hypothetical protein